MILTARSCLFRFETIARKATISIGEHHRRWSHCLAIFSCRFHLCSTLSSQHFFHRSTFSILKKNGQRTRISAAWNYHSERRSISSKIYDQLTAKGLLCSSFPDNVDVNALLSRKQTIYAGFDPTAPSLHVGNLLVLIALLHLIHHGHRVVVLVGDSTALIGDPSGKFTERPNLEPETVRQNADSIERDIWRILQNYRQHFASHQIGDDHFVLVRNSSWYRRMNPIDFIYRYGRQLRMGHLLSKSSVRERLESPQGLSFGEFSYQLFQAYDWLHLFNKYQCRFQIGGIDQTVNIHNGHDLIKKCAEDHDTFGLFIPLITDEKGQKIGKSDEGQVTHLSPDRTSPFHFFQYFMRLPDRDMSRFLPMFSFCSRAEIESMIQRQLLSPKPWRLQRKLAEEMTLLVHGREGVDSALRISRAFFEKDLHFLGSLAANEIADVFEGAEEYQLEFVPGAISMVDLAMRTNCFDSNLNAVNTIREGGFYVNYVKIRNPSETLSEAYILQNNITIVGVGKRNYRLVRWL